MAPPLSGIWSDCAQTSLRDGRALLWEAAHRAAALCFVVVSQRILSGMLSMGIFAASFFLVAYFVFMAWALTARSLCNMRKKGQIPQAKLHVFSLSLDMVFESAFHVFFHVSVAQGWLM